jgi:hypothetical protein
MGANQRGTTSPVAVVLLVGITVVLGGTFVAVLAGYAAHLHEPSFATVSTEQTVITDPGYISESGQDGCGNLEGHSELAIEVTLVNYQEADVIYVLVRDEGGEEKKPLWSDLSSANVGETLTLANEQTAMPGVDVDVGQDGNPAGGYALCPGESTTYEFYAENDGRTQLLQRFEFD